MWREMLLLRMLLLCALPNARLEARLAAGLCFHSVAGKLLLDRAGLPYLPEASR